VVIPIDYKNLGYLDGISPLTVAGAAPESLI